MTTTTYDPLSAARPDCYNDVLASIAHLCVSPMAKRVHDYLGKFAKWEPWDIAEYFDGEVPLACAAALAAYRGDRDACLTAMRAYVAELARS